jgi:hypothetical protein
MFVASTWHKTCECPWRIDSYTCLGRGWVKECKQ